MKSPVTSFERDGRFAPPDPYYGKYRGVVTHTNDPAMRGRIKAQVAFPLGDVDTEWAEPCFPPGHFVTPSIGDGVWIEFERGDLGLPIWTGQWYRLAEAPFQAPSQALQQDDEEAATTPAEDTTHAPFHDHQRSWYSPHARGWKSPTGHFILFDDWVDKDGNTQAIVLIQDRDGRYFMLHESGLVDIAGLNGNWVRIDDQGIITVLAQQQVHIVSNGDVLVETENDATVRAQTATLKGINRVLVDSKKVQLGDENGQQLMTKTDADVIKQILDQLVTHTHAAGTLVAPSGGGPVTGVTGGVSGGLGSYVEQLTTKTKAS